MKVVVLVLSGLLPAATALPPAAEAEGRHRILHAFQLLDQARHAQQERRVAVLHLLSETTYVPPGKRQPLTTTSRIVLMSRSGHSCVSTAEAQIYQDKQTQVCIVPAKRTILLSRSPRAEAIPWLPYSSELIGQAKITACALVTTPKGTQRHIVAVPAGGRLAGKVTSVEYWLDGRTDALQQIKMHYPAEYSVRSAAILFGKQEWRDTDPAVDTPAVSQVLDADNQLRPAFKSFTLQDLRR